MKTDPSAHRWQATLAVTSRFLRPNWGYGAMACVVNLLCAFFEGSSLGLLILALYLLGGTPFIELPAPFQWLAPGLERISGAVGRNLLFVAMAGLAVVTQVLRSLLQFAGQWFTVCLQTRVQAEVRSQIVEHVLTLPFSRASAYRLGDLTHRLSQAEVLGEFVSQMNLLLRSLFLVAVYALLLLSISWPLAIAAAGLYGIVSRLLHRVIGRVGRHAGALTQASVVFNERITEWFQALRLLHAFAREREVIRESRKIAEGGMSSTRLALLWGSAVEPLMDLFTVLGGALFLMGGFFLLGPNRSLATLLGFLVALHRLTPRLGAVHSSLAALSIYAPGIARIHELLKEQIPSEASVTSGRRTPVTFQRGIEFQRVRLRYQPDSPDALQKISFLIPRGSFTALVGPSGSGKSTLIDLLLGLYQPTQGSILVDGHPLSELDLTSWRSRLGVVPQDAFLFHGTLRENISFGKPKATREEILQAARAAYVEEFAARLPEGYDTVVGDRGFRLSGGERQRVTLARALVRQPEILILDEAFSALDSESEFFIEQALEKQRGLRTLLVIAHRLSTVSGADQILVLEHGRIRESGTHAELLLNRTGLYARLWQLQSEGMISEREAPVEGGVRS